MQDKKIVIIGDSPATYICGIYLFTANIDFTIVRKNMNLEYKCTYVPGVDANKEEYNQKCHDQAKNMGIKIINATDNKILDVKEIDSKYLIKCNECELNTDIIVTDMTLGLKESDNLFVVDNLLLEREAIVVAGTGCTIAFEIKDMMQ